MIGNRNIGSPENKNNESSFKCYNDPQSFALSKPPHFLNLQPLGAQFNKKDLKSENSMSTLKFQELGKEVLQFNSKESGNRLKARHKRFMTMEIEGQNTITNHSHNYSQLEGNSFSQLSFETKKNFNYSSKDCYWKTKTEPHEATIEEKSVRKCFFEEEETHLQIFKCHDEEIKKKDGDTQILERKKELELGKSNFMNFRPFERIKAREFVDSKIYENESCSSEITKTKPFKWISKETKEPNQSLSQQSTQSPELNNGESDDCIFKKTKKISGSKFQNNLPSQKNIYKPSILEKETSDENHTSNSSSKDTIYYGRVELQKTNSVSNRKEQHQNFNLESEMEKICIQPQNETHKKLDYSRLIQNSISTPSLKKHTQSVEEESEPSSSEEKEYEEIITTRLGIAKSLNNTYKKKNPKNSIGKLSDLNDELDLGLKLIDNSFEVSGFDYDYASSNIFSNGQECEENELNHELKTCYTGRSENETSKEEAILEESLISPECEALKNKLNRILSEEGKNCSEISKEQKLKVKRLSSEIFTQNNNFENCEQFKMPLLDLDTTLKDQSKDYAQNEFIAKSGHDSKYESYLYGSFIYSKSMIEEERKMLELETLGLRFDLKIGMLTQETVYLVSHSKEIMKLTNIISKIENFPKHFHVIQPYSLNYNMHSNRLTIIKDPILLANKFETIYPMVQACVLEVNLVGIRKIIKQVLSVMYQSISSESVFVDVRDIYILASKNKNTTDFNVKIDIAQSFLSQANTQQFEYSSFGQNVETLLKIIRILTSSQSTEVNCNNYDMKAHLESFVDLLEETLTGNKQVGIEEILIHPFVWQDSY